MDKLKRVKLLILPLISSLCAACAVVCPYTCNTSSTDNDITTNVQTRLAGDRGLSDENFHVQTYEREVTLQGTVQNPSAACVAVKIARSVPHVKCVHSALSIVNHSDP